MGRSFALIILVVTVLAACGGGDGGGMAGADTAAVAEGDPARGKEVYLKSGCSACHTFTPAGSTRNVGPNLDEAVKMYPAEFLVESITDPKAYIEKGESGSIGGDAPYRTAMPAYGPDEDPSSRLSEQELADLVAFLVSGK